MSNTDKSGAAGTATQLVIPAVVGAVVSAAVFALFLAFGPERAGVQPSARAPAPTTDRAESVPELDDTQRAAIEQTVRDYLLGNPQILVEISEKLEQQQAEEQSDQIKQAITENSDEIFRDDYGLEAGNPQGDVTVVEFSDYNCPYCKRAFDHVTRLIEEDKNVRVVMKEFPIFGEQSEATARAAIAAGEQGKFFEMHRALMNSRGRHNKQTSLRTAESLGLDMDKLRADMESDKVRGIIRKTRELGNALGIQGTPFFLVGDRVIPGAPDNLFEEFRKHIADVRENGCEATC